jgi:hypothetical protein
MVLPDPIAADDEGPWIVLLDPSANSERVLLDPGAVNDEGIGRELLESTNVELITGGNGKELVG